MASSFDFTDNSRAAQDLFAKAIAGNMEQMQEEYAADLSETLDEPPARTGRVYNINGKKHQASAPGQPPAVLSGDLKDSPTPTTIDSDKRHWEGAVVTDEEYAAILELGGVNGAGARIEPRPAWLKTIMENRKQYHDTATKGFENS